MLFRRFRILFAKKQNKTKALQCCYLSWATWNKINQKHKARARDGELFLQQNLKPRRLQKDAHFVIFLLVSFDPKFWPALDNN